MPATYNGIGTHYYGKKNLQVRPATCRQCGRAVNLSSYDTRLWFVILFVPIIPIGRKRIIDACPACRRHYVLDLRKWETAKQLEISGALEKFRSDPSPDSAIAAHRQLMAFHQLSEAADLQKLMVEKYPDSARVHAYLGAAWAEFGKYAESEAAFSRALALRPDMPEARIGMAEAHIRAKRLDEARKLLDILEKPGAAQLYSLGPLESLAIAYQQMGRHQEAMSLFGRLVAELPNISQHPAFRKMVKKSETALNQKTSILPKKKFSFKNLFKRPAPGAAGPSVSGRKLLIILGASAVVICIAMIVSNAMIRHHRKLYIANAYGGALRLEISGVGPVRLNPGITEVVLPEGHYVAKFSGPLEEEVGMDIQDQYFNRWFGKPVWLLNPGAAAILILHRAVYQVNPVPGTYHFVFGKSFQYFPHIDHPFESLPQSVSIPSGSSEVTLTGLEFFEHEPVQAFYALETERRNAEAADLAEWDLRRSPDDKEMMTAYTSSLRQPQELKRWDNFLRSGLTNRPVQIELHRNYQDLHQNQNDKSDLISLYDTMLQADPGSSALLYLRGRICDDDAESRGYFERALKADAENAYPQYALAYDESALGHWDAAEQMLRKVAELRPNDRKFLEDWKTACIAVGKYDAVKENFEAQLRKDPRDWKAAFSLCDVLVAEGQKAEAEQTISNVVRAIRFRAAEAAETIRRAGMARYYYAVGDFEALEKLGHAGRDENDKGSLFDALIEEGRMDDAVRIYSKDKVTNPGMILSVELAWRLAGKNEEAEKWRAAAADSLRSGSAHGLRAANLLDGKTAPTQAAVDDVQMPAQYKAILLAELAVTHPDQREMLGSLARRLNVDRTFPYHLINRALASAK
jgi:tetratricopeptide (TPR) repeat protein